jgi:hypothetical protein
MGKNTAKDKKMHEKGEEYHNISVLLQAKSKRGLKSRKKN